MTGRRFFVGVLVLLALGPAAATARVRTPIIHVLSNRADLISSGDALVSIDLPGRRNPQQVRRVRVYLNGHSIQSDFAVRANGRYEGLVTGLQDGAATCSARPPAQRHDAADHDHQPPQRRPGALRPAAPALGVPGRRGRCAVQPAAYATSTSTSRPTQRAGAPGLRPEQPSLGRRRDDDRPGRDDAVHRPRRDRLPGPRPIQDRDSLPAGAAVAAVGPAEPVEPQAADHPRRVLRRGPPDRQRPGRDRQRRRPRHGRHRGVRARAGLHDDVDRARQLGPQLQHRPSGRVAHHGQGAA